MPYDESKDKVLWEGEHDALKFSVHSYAGGEPKFQVGPRMVTNSNEVTQPRKAGRLTSGEVLYMIDNGDEILGAMDGTPAPKSKKKWVYRPKATMGPKKTKKSK